MKKHLILYSFISLVLFNCCNDKTTEYYPNGQIKSETDSISVGQYRVIRYYDNGKKQEEGKYSSNLRDGEWIEWYSNGSIRWQGEYVRGKIQYNDDDGLLGTECSLEYDRKENYFPKGVPTPIRVKIKGVNPFDISAITVFNGLGERSTNVDLFDYDITPYKEGEITVTLEIRINAGKKKGTSKRFCEFTIPVK